MTDNATGSRGVRAKRVRLTLTHDDFNAIMAALETEREVLREDEVFFPDAFRRIERVEAKIQAARRRMR